MEKIDKEEILLRPIKPSDEAGISHVIHTVLEEYGGNAPGFAGSDWATDHLFEHYQNVNGRYYVIEARGKIWGGGGFAPLDGGSEEWSELQKMYFLKEIRGMGLAREIVMRCLAEAKEQGYRYMYLETLTNMFEAQQLYKSFDFHREGTPRGNTGHFGCDVWMSREL